MNTVGVPELKNRLSEYLRRIHQGEEIFVTDRGRVVAELRQPGREPADAAYPGLERHARAGKARVGAPSRLDLYPPATSGVPSCTVRRLLDQEQGDRWTCTQSPAQLNWESIGNYRQRNPRVFPGSHAMLSWLKTL